MRILGTIVCWRASLAGQLHQLGVTSDVRTDTFAAEAHRQASLVAAADKNSDDQDFN